MFGLWSVPFGSSQKPFARVEVLKMPPCVFFWKLYGVRFYVEFYDPARVDFVCGVEQGQGSFVPRRIPSCANVGQTDFPSCATDVAPLPGDHRPRPPGLSAPFPC